MDNTRPDSFPRALFPAYRWLSTALVGLGAFFAFRLRPADPDALVLPPAHWWGAVVPFALAGGLLLLTAWVRDSAFVALRAPSRRWTCGGLIFLSLCVLGFRATDAYVSILILCLVPVTVALFVSRCVDRGEPLLLGLGFLVLALALFAVEYPGDRSGAPSVRWGDENTFSTLFPTKPPLIGAGGRLKPGLDVTMRSAELPQGARLRTNSKGFRNDEEFAPLAGPDRVRVLSLGDSFSVGMQVDQDAFFGPELEENLAALIDRVPEVLNAEVSDPAYGLYYLQHQGLNYHPDAVIYGVCANDMMQSEEFAGVDGLFRLDPGGVFGLNPDYAPKPNPLARLSHVKYPVAATHALAVNEESSLERRWRKTGRKLQRTARKIHGRLLRFRLLRSLLPTPTSRDLAPTLMHSYAAEYERADGHMRLLDGTTNLGYFYVEPVPAIEALYQTLFDLIRVMDRTAKAAGSRFVLVLHPQRYQVYRAEWEYIRDYWELGEDDFDLERYNERLRQFAVGEGVLCCDLLAAFRRESRPLYLPNGDMHYNAAGHELAAHTVAEFVAPYLRHDRDERR